jgi:AraC family transcriptional regulator, transcriptional activator FtrA
MQSKTATLATQSHVVAVLVYDGLAMFEFAAACETFGARIGDAAPHYELLICSAAPSVTTDLGLTLQVEHGLDVLGRADTLVVPPCDSEDAVTDEVLDAIRNAHERGVRILSLCTGAFLLAAAGLLDGRAATTHWSVCAELSRRYPSVQVDPDVLYVDGGDILTSAGSAASIDLSLYVIRQDHGAEVANQIARELVVPPFRDGGQAQYIQQPLPELGADDLFVATIAWMQANLDQPLSIIDLARRSAMSRRTFARRFAASTGSTPYQWLLRQRLQLAQQLLETSDLSIDSVAERSGFVNAGNLRKHFSRHVRTTPQAYRHTFRAAS